MLTAFQNDLLSEKDQGKTFDAEQAKNKMENGSFSTVSEIGAFTSNSWKKADGIDETESYLKQAAAVENLHKEIGITSSKTVSIPEESHIETCREKGSYLKTVFQTLQVHIDHKVTGKKKICQGHTFWKIPKYPFKWSAKKEEASLRKKLTEHPNVKPSFKTKVKKDKKAGWGVEYYWEHFNPDCGGITLTNKSQEWKCFHYKEQDIIQEKKRDEWITDSDLNELKYLQKECKLIQVDEYKKGNGTATDGTRVSRNAWEKRLVFSCASKDNSPCQRLRDLGGIFVAKSCIENDEEGNCLLFEKTYEMGKSKAAYDREAFHFSLEEERLFGLEEFDPSYEKSADFGPVFATYSAIADLQSQIASGRIHPDKPLIFGGHPSTCRKCFGSTQVFDCCYREGRGIIVGAGLGECSDEEKKLLEKVGEKKCHKVGSYRKGIIKRRSYCCFPTLIARIVQEQGREQLGIGWGTAEKPNCAGLTLRDLKRIDFEKIDFSDFTQSIKSELSSREIADKVKQLAKDFSRTNYYEKAKLRTEKIVEKQQQKIRLEGGDYAP